MDSNSVKNAVIQQVRTEASVANAQKLMNVRSTRAILYPSEPDTFWPSMATSQFERDIIKE